VIATDLSPAAIAIATRNAAAAAVADRVELRTGDLWAAVEGQPAFDLVVANPPYVRTGEMAGLSAEVRHEPALALDGGADGLAVIRPLVAGLAAHTATGAIVAIEHGHDQGADVRGLIDATGDFVSAITRNDLAGKPRVTWTRRASGR
jgi:release factor glutamine methyltransferase